MDRREYVNYIIYGKRENRRAHMKVQKLRITSLLLSLVLVAVCFTNTLNVEAKKGAASPAQYAAVFDASYYAAKYPDLKAVFGTDENALFNHFITSGMAEGRQASEEFNVQAYKSRYPDLAAAFGNNLPQYYIHYITSGKAEGRNGKAGATVSQTPTNVTVTVQTQAPANTTSSYVDQVVALVNQDRASNGVGGITGSPALNAAAQKRAEELKQSFSHTRPNGTSCFTVFGECGISYRAAGENIAWGQSSPAAVENCWMNSSGHRANILNPSYGKIGVGVVEASGRLYWVQLFTN